MLETSSLSKSDVHKIKSHIQEIAAMQQDDVITWIKKNIPDGYKSAYREIFDKNYRLISKHKIN